MREPDSSGWFRLRGLGGCHPYACWSLGLGVLGLAQVVLASVLLDSGTALAAFGIYGFMFATLASVLSIGLGLHAVWRYRWPGSGATSRAQKPTRRDLVIALLGIALSLLAIVLVVVVFLALDEKLDGLPDYSPFA